MKEGKKNIIDVTCAIIVDNHNRVFAAQRSEIMSLPLKWEFPGGKIELGETPENCLIREIAEELNIQVKTIQRLPSNIHSYPTITVCLIPFICKNINGEIILKEHADFKWFNRNELLDLDWAEADIPILKCYLNHLNYNSFTPQEIR